MITVAENDYMYLFHSTLFKIMTNLWNLNYVKSLTWLLLKLFYICCSSIIQDKAFHNPRPPPPPYDNVPLKLSDCFEILVSNCFEILASKVFLVEQGTTGS